MRPMPNEGTQPSSQRSAGAMLAGWCPLLVAGNAAGQGLRWQQARIIHARADQGTAYDAIRERVVVFGGYDLPSVRSDTLEWNGASWIERRPATVPPARSSFGMTYDRLRNRTV